MVKIGQRRYQGKYQAYQGNGKYWIFTTEHKRYEGNETNTVNVGTS